MMTLVSFQHYDFRMLQRDATPPCGVLMSMLSTQLHRRLSKVSKAAARGLQDMIVKKPHLLKPIQRLLTAVQHF